MLHKGLGPKTTFKEKKSLGLFYLSERNNLQITACGEMSHQKERLEISCTHKMEPSLLFPMISYFEEEENIAFPFRRRHFISAPD